MSYEESLFESEKDALENHEFISNVTSNSSQKGSFSATSILKTFTKSKSNPLIAIFGVILIVIIGIVVMQFDEEIPSYFNDLIIEATDVQNADHIESSKIVFEEALEDGDIPDDTTKYFNEKGYQIGYLNQDGNFIENNKSKVSSVLKKDQEIITSDSFIERIAKDVGLYETFKYAVYDKAAYYYDEAAEDVFKDIDASRNEFAENTSSFNSVMNSKLNTKNIRVNNVERREETKTDEDGNTYTVVTYEKKGEDINTTSSTAESLIENVINKNQANSSTEATLMSADELKVADTISKERRSMSFYVTFMENISKMKAGQGQNSRINDAMNFLYNKTENQVVDVNTGETVTVSGSPLESPSLNAILMGRKVDISKTTNYSSDRILTMAKNNLNLAQASINTFSTSDIINSTVTSVSQSLSSIGRLLKGGAELATSSVLAPLAPTISSSLIKSSLDNMNGIVAGEFLVEGAVNLGRNLAVHGSGATAGDTQAVLAYQKLNNQILAMDAAADRLNRSPFDITSRNTFLGSIIYQFATTLRSTSIFSGISTLTGTTSKSLLSLFPSAFAADEANNYLSTFGQCETYATIGATGTAHCSEIATFDTSTLDDPLNNPEYQAFVEENTILENGERVVKPGSYLAMFIDYNNNRKTPLGTTDGGILKSLNSGSSNSFTSDITSLISLFSGASEESLRIATGAAFVNSSDNPDWIKYRNAQRYVSIARAAASMRSHSSDPNAYTNIKYHEGSTNPVIAYMHRENSDTVLAEESTTNESILGGLYEN